MIPLNRHCGPPALSAILHGQIFASDASAFAVESASCLIWPVYQEWYRYFVEVGHGAEECVGG